MEKLLKNILRDQIQLKGFSLERIRRETGIAERYLSALIEGEPEKLPAPPYVRGYLMKLGLLLELNGNELWETYRSELSMKSSGAADRLPENRFALKKISRRWIAVGAALLLVGAYAAVNANRLLGKPGITITNPSVETLVTTAHTIAIAGNVDLPNTLKIDGEVIEVDATGRFETIYPLRPGLNRIEFSVRKLLGRETQVFRHIIYQPQ